MTLMSLDPSIDQTERGQDAAPGLRALLVVSPDGRIQFATARADLWMKDFFGAAFPLDRLPEALTRWLEDGTSGGQPSRFIVDRPEGLLFVRLLYREAGSTCLVLERNPGVLAMAGACSALTDRQTEVLAWVARGKTNAEIAKILSL
jgi:DNA-binding NarL/FixJ family response regulator